METLLTIAEASRLTGKHRDTIRKWAKLHPDGVKKNDEGRSRIVAERLSVDYPTVNREEARRISINAPVESAAESGEIEALKAQIEAMQKRNDELMEKNEKLNDRVAGFADALIRLTDQQQQLTAQINQHLLSAKNVESKKKRWFGR